MSAGSVDATEKMQREFVTPEGVDLRLQLGDAGQRAGAFLLDCLIILAVMVAMLVSTLIIPKEAGKVGNELREVLITLGLFLLFNGYFIAFELRAGAATPGKRALGLRVAARNGGRLTADAIIARNILRYLEVLLPMQALFEGLQHMAAGGPLGGWIMLLTLVWIGIFILFPLFNRDRLRVGDLLAGTWVVRSPKQRLIPDLSDDSADHAARFAFTRQQLEAYGVKELHVLEEVLRRGDRKTMRAVAERIQRKIAWAYDDTVSDRDFLSGYYAALRQRLEQRLLFGHRRRDKFDKA